MNTAALEGNLIRFEIRDGMRRISCAVSNDALEAASGLTDTCTPAARRKSFDRFRTVIHAAALLKLKAQRVGRSGLIIVTGRDLRRVPPQVGAPKFGSSGDRPTLPIAFEVAPGPAAPVSDAAMHRVLT